MKKINDFAAVFGPTTVITAEDQNGTVLEWVSVKPDSGKEKGKQIVMPLSMLMNTEYPEVLEGYFPIYERAARPLGRITSKATVTAVRRPKKDMKEVAAAAAKKRAAESAAAAAAGGATTAANAGVAGGGGGGGMRGGGGRRGGGMRGGGGRRGGGGGRGGMRGDM